MYLALVALLATTLLGACGHYVPFDIPAAPSGSSVNIVEISPTTEVPLPVGQVVNLRVKIEYTLTSDSGTLSVVIQDANYTPLTHTSNFVSKGSATEVVDLSFKVPETKSVHVFTALFAQGQNATSTMSRRAYKTVRQ